MVGLFKAVLLGIGGAVNQWQAWTKNLAKACIVWLYLLLESMVSHLCATAFDPLTNLRGFVRQKRFIALGFYV